MVTLLYVLVLCITGAVLAQIIIDITNPWDGYGY